MKHSHHILFAFAFGTDGKAHHLDNEQVGLELKNENLAWVHLDANHRSTKKWLEREVNYLDHLIIDALLAEEPRPRIMEFDEGLLIILRGANLNHNAEPEDMVSIRMWIDKERVITIQRREMKAVMDMHDQIVQGKSITNSSELLYNMLHHILTVTSPYLYALNQKIDILEEKILTTHDLKLREEILQIRTQSTIFKRYLAPQRDVISKLRASNRSWIDDWAIRHFQENLDLITTMLEEVEEAANRSQILHDELANALTEKLNKNMFKLSLITVVFMPLTFVTGLFGMNVGGIPGGASQFGFYLCLSAMLIIAALQILFFKMRDWF